MEYSSGELNFFQKEELMEIVENVRFKEIRVKLLDYNLRAAPPFFCLDSSSLEQREREIVEKEYERAVEMIRNWGESSPPAAFIKATK